MRAQEGRKIKERGHGQAGGRTAEMPGKGEGQGKARGESGWKWRRGEEERAVGRREHRDTVMERCAGRLGETQEIENAHFKKPRAIVHSDTSKPWRRFIAYILNR